MSKGDLQILELIKEFRLVTREQLEQLTGRQTIWRRLQVKGHTSPLIASKKVFYKRPSNKSYPFVFSDHPIDRRSESTMAHELLITDIHIALHKTGFLTFWDQGKEAWKGAVHQDAFAILRNPSVQGPEDRMHVFIEADQGSENHQQIVEKFQTYIAYPDKPFRVLFVSLSPLRAQNLKNLAENFIKRQERFYFLFTSADALKSNALARICLMPHEENSSELMPRC
jgi:hypothetical protein